MPDEGFIDFAAVIDLFGGASEYARAVGISYNTAKQHRWRKSIPSDLWMRVVVAAQECGLPNVTAEALARVAAKAKADAA